MAAPRAMASGTISFGLVSIPVKIYTATSAQSMHFNQLHKGCGSRLKQQLVCASEGVVVDRDDIVKGYEYAKDQYVQFDNDELKKLEGERTSALDIVEFVPLATVDLMYIEKSYYLGPDKGGNKAYRLLANAMERTGKVAVGRYGSRGKEQLVLIRPYKNGLLLHQVFYADEVRAFEDVDMGQPAEPKPGEIELADQLIGQLSTDKFDAEKFKDEYRQRVMDAVEQKIAGQEITVAPEQPTAQIIDLFDALKQSLGKGMKKVEPPAEAVPLKIAKASKRARASGED